MKRIENREILQQVRKETSEKIEKSRCRILICAGTGCLAGGSGEIYEKMCELTAENPDVDVFFGPEIAHTEAEQKTGPVEVKKSGCHGFCEMGPLMRIEPMGILYTKVQLSDCEEIFYRTIERGDVIRHLLFKQDGIEYKKQEEIPFYKKQTRNVLKNCGHIDSEHIQEYIAAGGYRALEKVLFEMTPAQVIEEISESNLRGRGGMVFCDGKPLTQVSLCNGLGEKDGTYWVEANGQRVHFRLWNDEDPADHRIEVTCREQCFAPDEPFLSYIKVKGLTCAHAATGAPVPQRGAISCYRVLPVVSVAT
mgnify:CR=1 FL=1